MRVEPFNHRLGMLWKIVVAVPAPGRPLNPEQSKFITSTRPIELEYEESREHLLLVIDRNVIEDLLHVAGLGQRVIVYLYDERRDPDILRVSNRRPVGLRDPPLHHGQAPGLAR
jgi:hypothetical protein